MCVRPCTYFFLPSMCLLLIFFNVCRLGLVAVINVFCCMFINEFHCILLLLSAVFPVFSFLVGSYPYYSVLIFSLVVDKDPFSVFFLVVFLSCIIPSYLITCLGLPAIWAA